MSDETPQRTYGNWGEEKAARYLERCGLRVVYRQYRQPYGEIDLVCREKETWVFVEVKTRFSLHRPSAVESITFRKQQRMIRAALSFMKWKRLEGDAMRFDLVLIEAGRVEWIVNAFEPPGYFTY